MTAKTVLMIHGAGGGGWEWTVWSHRFTADGWRVVAPDLMPADAGLAATRLSDYQTQVQQWCATYQPGLLVGASLGGLLALSAATLRPGQPLVLVNPLPPAGLVAPSGAVRQREGAVIRWQRDASLLSTADALPDATPDTWHLAWRRWRDESAAVLAEATAFAADAPPPVRCLVLASDQDRDLPMASSRALAHWLGADLVEIPAASHVGPLLGRSAAATAERVLAWARLRS